jgi:hypothetical protein
MSAMKTRLSFNILCLTLLSANLLGQINYKKGFIITNQQDTLRGLISDAGTIRNSRVCVYKADLHSIPVKYYPNDIQFFALDGDKQYQSLEVFEKGEFKKTFLEVLVKGNVNLYYFYKNNEMKFFIEKTKDSLIALTNKKVPIPISTTGLYGLINNDKSPLQSDRFEEQFNANIYIDLYKDTLATLFSDKQEIVNELPNLKYTHRSIMGITKEYIYQSCGEGDCLQYEKNLKLSKPYFGFYSGIQLSNMVYWKSKGLSDKSEGRVVSNSFPSVPVGLFIEFPLTRISELISLKVEMKINNIDFNQGTIQLPDSLSYILISSGSIGFPVSLHYRVLNSKISPTIGAGKNFSFIYKSQVTIEDNNELALHKNQRGGWFAELGVDYKIKPRFIAFADLRVESFKNLIINANSTSDRVGYTDIIENKPYDLFTTRCFSFHLGFRF